ncbi:hypothetical protein COL26b_004078 [Colletotrichum chrysophilum]|uniref:uncharacterized protein n=1 Tax=Colletotrichum chrysophilum TaxID=1836956 RepID=UPI0023004C96|nr:uncharacterized protein COL26b_004078 [Colletotrichum chrysophilum]KAJ0377608.1 hypothetical protein COL26b_004078 [Colletotrichum chrysophilum]
MVLQEASANTTAKQTYGRWAFSPVTDGVYIKSLASEQLTQKKVNGERLLVGIDDIVAKNPTKTGANDTRFETNGLTGLTALDVSQAGAGPLQQAINIYAEQTFVCPSYWLSSAFTGPKAAWHYQYSVPFAWHTSDVPAYFGPATPNQGSEFVLAFRKIWGNFITKNDPSISNEEANGASSADSAAKNGASEWPAWIETEPKQLNLNQTGGVPYQFTTQWGVTVTQFQASGQVNAIAVVPADSWEGGRGSRCDFWKTLAPSIPA